MTSGESIALVWAEILWALQGVSYVIFFIEAHTACIVVLIFLITRQQAALQQSDAQWAYSHALLIKIIYCISSMLRALVDVDIIPKTGSTYFILTVANIILFGMLNWLAFLFNATYQDAPITRGKVRKFLTSVPLLIIVLMLLISPVTDIFLEIRGNVIMQSKYFFIVPTVFLAYPLFSIIMTLFRRKFFPHHEHEMLMTTLIYPALFLVCGIVRSFEWKVHLMCYAIIISDVYVYLSYSDSLISVDPLTKIPNRNGMLKALSERIGSGKNLDDLYVFAIDIEDLNDINAKFGRHEGDKALTIVAEGLRKFQTQEHQCHISRYYSDEFIIAADIPDSNDVGIFIEHIRNYVSNAVMAANLEYMIRISVGYARYEHYSKTETIPGLLEEASRMRNEDREQRKFQFMWRGTR